MKKTILVVDDDAFIYKVLSSYLLSKGYETVWAKNGQEGYETFVKILPDLIITDILMPVLNGPDMLKKIREHKDGEKAPVFVMSSIEKSFKMQRDVKHNYGAGAFLKKPFDLPVLLKLVKEHIGQAPLPENHESGEKKPAEPAKIIKGAFDNISYAKVLHQFHKRKSTGCLDVKSNRKQIKIYFQNGNPVDIKSNYLQEDSLLRILRTMTPGDDDRLDQWVNGMEEKGLLQCEALVEMGVITRNQLSKALREQTYEKIITPFGWQSGAYKFTEGIMVQDTDFLLSEPLINIILRGISTHFTQKLLKELFGGKENRTFVKSKQAYYNTSEMILSDKDTTVIELLDLGYTVSKIIEKSKADAKRTLELVFLLSVLGIYLLENEKEEKKAKEKTPPVMSDKFTGRNLILGIYSSNFGDSKAEDFFDVGSRLMISRNYTAAADSFEIAIALDNHKTKYFAMMALAILRMNKKDSDRYVNPKSLLDHGIRMNRNCSHIRFVFGQLAKDNKQFTQAKSFFESALSINPDHEEAQRELRLVKMKLRSFSA